jgi:hypothetical protein
MGSIKMTEPARFVLVTLLCAQRGHTMAELATEGARLFIDSYAHGTTYLPDGLNAEGQPIGFVRGRCERFDLAPELDEEGDPLALLMGRRYGCRCSGEAFMMSDQEWRNAVADGITVLRRAIS